MVENHKFNKRFIINFARRSPFWFNGDITFPLDADEDWREYRTVFGPCFAHNGKSYLADNIGLKYAIRRMTAKREPDKPLLHECLVANQYVFMIVFVVEVVYWEWSMRNKMGKLLDEHMPDTRYIEWLDEGPKKRLKWKAQTDLYNRAANYFEGTRVPKVKYKCKTGEILAPGKKLRGIGDLGVEGSMVLGSYMTYVKQAFSQPFSIHGGTSRYCAPKGTADMQEVFRILLTADRVQFIYFSDDSVISVPCVDGMFWANLDIKACDGSNYQPVFDMLYNGISVHSEYQTAIDSAFQQCVSPFVVTSSKGNTVLFQPVSEVLYSGSTLTTSINNMANTLIFISIMCIIWKVPVLTKAIVRNVIVAAAHNVGYVLKIDECECFEDFQFLKHSPSLVDGTIVPFLNLGVWFRMFGTTKYDLAGRGSVLDRARIFNSEVVRSRIHSGDHAVHDAFKTYVVSKRMEVVVESPQFSLDEATLRLPDQALLMRYRLTPAELDELCEFIRAAGVCDLVQHPAILKILDKDYGYPPVPPSCG